ncbi:MAG TPA: MASE1 domain-containing protein [Burkholderiales bacterium]|nr:MASE1 domain-containing protein [Burkholderiales bacterium]
MGESIAQPSQLKLAQYAGILAFGTVAYWLLGQLGVHIAHVHEPYVGPLGLAAGVGFALLIIFGYRYWPAIAIGTLAVGLQHGLPPLVAGAIAVANVLNTLLAVYLLRRYADFDRTLGRLRDAMALVLICAFLGCALACATAVAVLWFAGMVPQDELVAVWLNRWLASAAGVLVVAPYLLALAASQIFGRGWRWYAEAAALIVVTALVAAVAFTPLVFADGQRYPLAFAPLPTVMWAALRFAVPGAATASLLVAAISLAGTLSGAGPFAPLARQESLALLASYNAWVAMSGLVMGAAVAELGRKAASGRLG